MKILADEGIDAVVVKRLRDDGHQVWYVAEMQPGIADTAVLSLAIGEGALLLTADRDFGELVFRLGWLTSGMMLLRLSGLAPLEKAEIVSSACCEHSTDLPRSFSVLAKKTLRVRRQRHAKPPTQ